MCSMAVEVGCLEERVALEVVLFNVHPKGMEWAINTVQCSKVARHIVFDNTQEATTTTLNLPHEVCCIQSRRCWLMDYMEAASTFV